MRISLKSIFQGVEFGSPVRQKGSDVMTNVFRVHDWYHSSQCASRPLWSAPVLIVLPYLSGRRVGDYEDSSGPRFRQFKVRRRRWQNKNTAARASVSTAQDLSKKGEFFGENHFEALRTKGMLHSEYHPRIDRLALRKSNICCYKVSVRTLRRISVTLKVS